MTLCSEHNKVIVVIIATHNGGDVLRLTLEGYLRQLVSNKPWKLVIVDNNSTDNTRDILDEFSSQLPLTTIFTSRPGKNCALNCAIDIIGPYDDFIIFSDDDAIPAPDFILSWERADLQHQDTDLFAGQVEPSFPANEPSWLRQFEDFFNVLYARNIRPDGEIAAREIFGPNMAIRRWVLAKGLRYDETIGPNSSDPNYPMGSETEFCVRAETELKATARFVSSAAVLHQVRSFQMEMSFIARRAYRHGRGFSAQLNVTQSHLRPAAWKVWVRLIWYRWHMQFGDKRSFWNYHWWRGYRARPN